MKQGTIFGSIMCCVSTSKVNTIQEAVKYQYGKMKIDMPVFINDIAAARTTDNIKKGLEIEKDGDWKENDIRIKEN